jgi:hypothetical protein
MGNLSFNKQRQRITMTNALVPGSPEFLRAVRKAAGWRVSPRHVDPVIVALHQAGKPITVERVAELVNELRGERSHRQRRNTDLWQMLGAHLALQGQPAHPEAQRALLGRIKRLVAADLPDSVLLTVAVHVAAAGHQLEAHLVAHVVHWLLEHYDSAELDSEQLERVLPQAIHTALRRPRTQRPSRQPATRTRASQTRAGGREKITAEG